MKKYEYMIEPLVIDCRSTQESQLDDFGKEGWELCCISNTKNEIYCFFKRELKENNVRMIYNE